MKHRLSVLGYVACACLLSATTGWGWPAAPSATTLQSAESESTAVLVNAQTIVVIGLTGTKMMDRLWADPDGERAERKVEAVLTDWGKYEIVEDPGQADLVLLVIESQKNLSLLRLANLVAEVRVYRRGQMITPKTPTLWAGEAVEGFGKLPSTTVAERFRDYVSRLPQPGTQP